MDDFSQFEIDEAEADELTAKATEFWSRPLFSASELAEMDEVTRAYVALVHPPHTTLQ